MKFEKCEMTSEQGREEIATYIFEDRNKEYGKKFKRYKVSKYWLDSNSISVDSPCVSRIGDTSKGYIRHYK